MSRAGRLHLESARNERGVGVARGWKGLHFQSISPFRGGGCSIFCSCLFGIVMDEHYISSEVSGQRRGN